MKQKTDIDFSQGVTIRASDGKYIVQRPSGPWDVWPDTPYMDDVEAWIAEGGKPQPEPLPPAPTDAQLEAAAEAQRQARFAAYDTAIMQLRRHERLGDATATAKIAEWDAYAMALEAVNDTDGWFRAPEWPEKPEA